MQIAILHREAGVVPAKKLSLLGSAWPKCSSSLVTHPGLSDWLTVVCVWGAVSRLLMESQHPLGAVSGRGRGQDQGWGSHFSSLTATSAFTARISLASRGLLSPGRHNAGYFHPDVLCHHRSCRSVLHYLSAVVPAAGKMELKGRASCLLPHRWSFCFWSLFRVLIQKQNEKRACFPIYLSDALVKRFSAHSEKNKKCKLPFSGPNLKYDFLN